MARYFIVTDFSVLVIFYSRITWPLMRHWWANESPSFVADADLHWKSAPVEGS